MYKKKIMQFIVICVFFIFLVLFSYSLYHIVKWKSDSNYSFEQIEMINKVVTIEENNDGEILSSEHNHDNPYWDFIKYDLISVNFNELKSINSDVVGWIQVAGTNINYPIVQANDNDFYLNHSFDKTTNEAGWVFMDYRNNVGSFDKNTIIYAHSRLDNSMFGTLRNVLSNGWLSNSDNYVIKLSTESENTLWQVFSVYRIPTTSDYLSVEFSSLGFSNFINTIVGRSQYNFNTNVSDSDRILTLSTCYDDNSKLVIHAKLIKRQDR